MTGGLNMTKIDMKKYKKNIVCGATALAVMTSAYGIGATFDTKKLATGDVTTVYKYDAAEDNSTEVTEVTEEATSTPVDEENILAGLSSEFSIEEKDVNKDETVYGFAKADGSIDHIIVSETLKNKDKLDVLMDKTNLKDVENVKGDETFEQNGEEITWQANGNDITYQGTTDAKLPVDLKVSYYLDGNKIAPEQLAGKSGKVTIRFDYVNNETTTVKIAGEDETIYVPFVAVTGMMIGDNFQNVAVTNGKVVSEGATNIVLGYAMPGMKENLQTKEDEESVFTDFFEVTADVTDFSLDMTVTLLTTASAINISGDIDLTKMDEMVETIKQAGGSLTDGSAQLSDGLNTLQDKMGEFNSGVSQLKSGLEALSSGSSTLADGVATINASANALNAGIEALNAGVSTPMSDDAKSKVAAQAKSAAEQAVMAQFENESYEAIASQASGEFKNTMTSEQTVSAIQTGLNNAGLRDALFQSVVAQKYQAAHAENEQLTYEMYMAGLSSNPDAVAQIYAYVDGLLAQVSAGVANGIAENGAKNMGDSVAAACEQAAVSAAGASAGQAAVAGAEGAKAEIAQQINAVQGNGYSLVTGAQALAGGTSQLEASVPTLTGGVSQLLSGANSLAAGAGQIKDGVKQLADGSGQLKDGINQFNHEAIDKLAAAYDGDVKSFVGRMSAMLEASMKYETFTELKDGDAGVTKFIIKTEGVK